MYIVCIDDPPDTQFLVSERVIILISVDIRTVLRSWENGVQTCIASSSILLTMG